MWKDEYPKCRFKHGFVGILRADKMPMPGSMIFNTYPEAMAHYQKLGDALISITCITWEEPVKTA